MPEPQSHQQPAEPPDIKRKVLINFGIFAVFFIYYVGAAIIQTPHFKDLAGIPLGSVPLGLALSMGIFPMSWLLIVVFFWKSR